jgi:hypothetical protein
MRRYTLAELRPLPTLGTDGQGGEIKVEMRDELTGTHIRVWLIPGPLVLVEEWDQHLDGGRGAWVSDEPYRPEPGETNDDGDD